jgi:polysaccharide lyase-like protein
MPAALIGSECDPMDQSDTCARDPANQRGVWLAKTGDSGTLRARARCGAEHRHAKTPRGYGFLLNPSREVQFVMTESRLLSVRRTSLPFGLPVAACCAVLALACSAGGGAGDDGPEVPDFMPSAGTPTNGNGNGQGNTAAANGNGAVGNGAVGNGNGNGSAGAGGASSEGVSNPNGVALNGNAPPSNAGNSNSGAGGSMMALPPSSPSGAGGSAMAAAPPLVGAAGGSMQPSQPPVVTPPTAATPVTPPPVVPTPPAPIAAPDCNDLFLCDDFEGSAVGAQPNPAIWSLRRGYSGMLSLDNFAIDDTTAHAGNQSLRLTANGGDPVGVVAPAPGDAFFLRVWMMFENPQVNAPVFIGVGIGEDPEIRMRSKTGALVLNASRGDGLAPDPANCTTCIAPPSGWFCAEMFLDRTAETATLWIDGQEAGSVVGNQGWHSGGTWPAQFEQVRIGPMGLEGGTTTTWIDDVAFGSERIGCN